MGLTTSRSLTEGHWVDVILFPSLRSIKELFARPQADRMVIRHGQLQAPMTLPDFAEVDDLM